MKRLTVLAFLAVPITVFSQLFSLSVGLDSIPFHDSPYGFWIVTGLGVLTSFVLYLFFRFKKWL